jgi:hypothetical protein
MINPNLLPTECGITYEEIAVQVDSTKPLWQQSHLLRIYPAWWLEAATDPDYRRYIEIRKALEARHKKLLKRARYWRKRLHPESYSPEGKRRHWPAKKNRALTLIERRLRGVLEEFKQNDRRFHAERMRTVLSWGKEALE